MLGRQSSRSDMNERHPWQEGVTTASDRVVQRTTILGEDTLEIGEGEIPRYMMLETVIMHTVYQPQH